MKRSTIYTLFVCCLLLAIAAPAYYGYAFFVKQGEVKALERDLSLEQTKLEVLRQKGKTVDVAESQRLQTRVPTVTALDTVIESLSQASLLSNVNVMSIAFSDGEGLASDVPVVIDPSPTNTTSEPSASIDVAPVNASTVRTTVALQAETYEELVLFLEAIESMNRIQVLRTVQFTGPSETGPNTTEEAQPLDFTVELNAFYRPDLDQLVPDRYIPAATFPQKDVPVYDYTSP
ncbi:hypothetical protein [Exiguobacterium algae]|uniref:hypothetical protein n=1 Tax=Exiguobacterium algae TaxID=2751250 RepID=UPI001BEA8BFA|nr:hypothetical protein [Exiguobacterium algae]